MKRITLLASEKQFEAIELFFWWQVEDILYWGAARWGKSETIGMILAIVIAAMPGSSWLIARTVLSDLKATTLSTFYNVIERFGYGEKSWRDKIKDERHILFNNRSKLYVLQVNYEPGDPEFDRLGSFWYTWCFLDEGQQMSNKVREVLQGRLSELDGSFVTEVPMSYADIPDKDLNPWFEVEFKIVWQTVKNREDRTIEEYEEEIIDGSRICYITRTEILRIPYTLMKSEIIKDKLFHTYAWSFKGCIFTGCNPGTNFTRNEFYKPYKNGSLASYMAFIPAKVWDNPWVGRDYIERLERLPESSIRKQRLLYGNFDYDDNPWLLYDEHTISQMFEWEYEWDDTMYMIVDAARQGKDKTEIWIFRWLHLIKIITIDKWDLVTQAEKIRDLANMYNISIKKNTLVDEVWVWGWLIDILWCLWFIGNAAPIHPYSSKFLKYKKRNYANLRTQAFYYLQKYIPKMKITCDGDTRTQIIEELLTIKEEDVTNDSKLKVIKKSLIKQEIWRSPDKADMLSMRMWFNIKYDELNPPKEEEKVEEKRDPFWDHIMWLDKQPEDIDVDVY